MAKTAFVTKSFVINIILIFVALAASYSAARMVRNAMLVRAHSNEITQKIEQLKLKKKELEAQLMEIQTKEAVEREGKERFNLKKSGEQVIVVVPEKKDNPPISPRMSFWEKLKSFFNR